MLAGEPTGRTTPSSSGTGSGARAGWPARKSVSVGDGVLLGGGVIVCAGVTIGEDAGFGAGSAVTRDVPPRVFAAGNPGRVIRALDEAPST